VLPWEINAVMLADTLKNYKRHEDHLIAEFSRQFPGSVFCSGLDMNQMIKWIDRQHPRKYVHMQVLLFAIEDTLKMIFFTPSLKL
jgi:hypothetical protein